MVQSLKGPCGKSTPLPSVPSSTGGRGAGDAGRPDPPRDLPPRAPGTAHIKRSVLLHQFRVFPLVYFVFIFYLGLFFIFPILFMITILFMIND